MVMAMWVNRIGNYEMQLSTVVLERRKHDVTVTLDGYKAEVDE